MRLVRTRDGGVEIDPSGKKEGRGAYICPDTACLEKALSGKQLENTLKCTLNGDNRERLARDGRELLKELISA